MGSYSLGRKERIKKRNDFQRVLKKGRCLQTNFLRAFFLRNNLGYNRVGIGCVREAWNKKTFLRNRAKRLIKEAYRKNKAFLKPGFDIILIGKKIDKIVLSKQIEEELRKIFETLD